MNLSNTVHTDQPIKSRHNRKATNETIKKILANGTPHWVRFPHEYKSYVKESFAAEKQQSDELVAQYRLEGQDELTDFKARYVNIKQTIDIINTLRKNGVKCFTIDNGLEGTIALWAQKPGNKDYVYVTYIQIPFCPEWDILRLDRHDLPAGLDYRGWRSMMVELVKKEVLTEERAHEIFGKPVEGRVSRFYRRNLYDYRNRKINEKIEAKIA